MAQLISIENGKIINKALGHWMASFGQVIKYNGFLDMTFMLFLPIMKTQTAQVGYHVGNLFMIFKNLMNLSSNILYFASKYIFIYRLLSFVP